MAAPRSVLALLSAAAAAAAGPVLSCGDSLCFSGHFNDNAVMQRAPNKAAYYGSVPTGSPAGVLTQVTAARVGNLVLAEEAVQLRQSDFVEAREKMLTGVDVTNWVLDEVSHFREYRIATARSYMQGGVRAQCVHVVLPLFGVKHSR